MSRIRQNCFSAGFHQPFRCGGCPTYSDGLHAFQQFPVDFLWSVYLIRIRIYLETFLKQNLPVLTFMSAYKEYQIVAGCKLAYIRHAVCYLTAYCIVILKSRIG